MDDKKNLPHMPLPGLEDLLGLSSHRNGFKRENAVRRMGMLGDPASIPLLVVRANDWVPQVRAAARDALMKLLRPGAAEAFVASLPAIMHLQACTRDDHRGLVRAVQDFLLTDDNVNFLVAAVRNPDAPVARLAIRLLVERRALSPAALVAQGLRHEDVVVRSTVVDLLRELSPEEFAAAVETARRDPYMPVRREAFQQLLARDREAGLRLARDLLFDRSASVREIAVRRLLDAGAPVEHLYAGALTWGATRAAVVACVMWGWGFMNCQNRSEQVRQMLDHRSPAVRRAALQTIAKLLGNDAGPYLEVALADESPAVCKEAARLIAPVDEKPTAERLVSIARASGLHHVAVACCRAARCGSKWDWLTYILKVYGAVDAAVSPEAFSAEIDAWELAFNFSSAQPDAGSLEEIVSALRVCEDKLTAKQLRLLKFTLRTSGAKF